MKNIKYFKEAYTQDYSEHSEFIKSIWFTNEEEIQDALIDLHDEMDIKVKIEFHLKSKKDNSFNFKDFKDKEKVEAFAAMGFKQEIIVTISNEEDISRDSVMCSYAIEGLTEIEDYSIIDVKKRTGGITLKLEIDENSTDSKQLYHKISIQNLSTIFSNIKKSGYDVEIEKFFSNGQKSYIKYHAGYAKVYQITISKVYDNNLDTIDILYEDKKLITECLSEIDKANFFDKVYSNFELGTPDTLHGLKKSEGKISPRLIIQAIEK